MAKIIHSYEYRQLGRKAKNYFEKYFFNLMSNAVFAKKKNMKNMRKQRHIKLVTAKARENYLSSLLNFKRNVLAIEMKKKHLFMNKQVYLDLSILEINKVVIYEF